MSPIFHGYTFDKPLPSQVERHARHVALYRPAEPAPACCCYEIAGDNEECPIHGSGAEADDLAAEYEAKAYREMNESIASYFDAQEEREGERS